MCVVQTPLTGLVLAVFFCFFLATLKQASETKIQHLNIDVSAFSVKLFRNGKKGSSFKKQRVRGGFAPWVSPLICLHGFFIIKKIKKKKKSSGNWILLHNRPTVKVFIWVLSKTRVKDCTPTTQHSRNYTETLQTWERRKENKNRKSIFIPFGHGLETFFFFLYPGNKSGILCLLKSCLCSLPPLCESNNTILLQFGCLET